MSFLEHKQGPPGPQIGPLAFNRLHTPFYTPVLSPFSTPHPQPLLLSRAISLAPQKSCSKQLECRVFENIHPHSFYGTSQLQGDVYICLKHVQDVSGTRTRCIRASAKPRDKAAVRTYVSATTDTGRTHTEHVQDASGTCRGCCECYLGAELCRSTLKSNLKCLRHY